MTELESWCFEDEGEFTRIYSSLMYHLFTVYIVIQYTFTQIIVFDLNVELQ